MNTGRNSPCPCGSGKKYKHCCLNKGRKPSFRTGLLLATGSVILVICIILLVSSIRNYEAGPANRVWSEEHQHWHYLD